MGVSWLQELGLSSSLSGPQFPLCQLKILKTPSAQVRREGPGRKKAQNSALDTLPGTRQGLDTREPLFLLYT